MNAIKPVADFEVPGHRLVRRLGEGGMATVWLAIQASLGRPVAMKILQAPSEEAVARFEQEAHTIARLSHPHIVTIYEVGRTSDGQLYYTMPFLPNGDLSKLDLTAHPSRIAAVMRQLLGALDYAHRHGIVHRDVKPENALFDQHGRALLTDFGIARTGQNGRVTRSGLAIGSSSYMSPEQARGLDTDGRSDLYSLGVVCFEALTGKLPFHGADALSTAIAHLEQPVPRLPEIRQAWQPFIDKALAKQPDERYQSAQEMLTALGRIDDRPTSAADAAAPRANRMRAAAAPSAHAAPALFAQRPTWLIGGGLLTILLIAIGTLAFALHRHRGTVTATNVAATQPATAPVAGPAQTSAPAPQASATQAAPSPPAPAASSAATGGDVQTTAEVRQLLADGDALMAQGNMFTPRRNSALDRYRLALKLDPDNSDVHARIGDLVAVLQARVGKAWQTQRLEALDRVVKRTDELAVHTDAPSQKNWREARGKLAHDVGAAVADAVQKHDADRIKTLMPLARALPAVYPQGFDRAQLAATLMPAPAAPIELHAGAALRDPDGPALVYVPASEKSPAFAIARNDVTRGEYAAFVRATGRAAARCAEPLNLFSRMRGLSWRNPGFAQGDNHPAVCVSWQDAAAYAAWLSKRTGHPYRLPSGNEWLRAARGMPAASPCARGNIDDKTRASGFDNDAYSCSDGAAETSPVGRYLPSAVGAYDMYGNVSDWLEGAGRFRGLSWRDGSHQAPFERAGSAALDQGYTSVGFRVVRVIDTAHPAPTGD